ncbi:MAG: MFS transporter [Vicinamibacterales bacterium]
MSTFVRTPCDTGAVQGRPCARTIPSGPWTLAVAILGSSMAFVDGTVTTVALPAMADELSATAAQLQWVVEAYSLVLSSLVLVGGSLGDQMGRARTFAAGVAIVTMASAGCGLAPTMGVLIGLRAIQGLGAALLVPGSLALISDAYAEDERGRAIGTWSAFSGIAAAIGPVVGGWFVEHQSWRWAFYINVPVGVLVLSMVARLPRPAGRRPLAVDWTGAALTSLGLAAIVYALVDGSERGWTHASTWSLLAAGVLCLALFVRVERRAAAPMLPLELFRSPTFAGANLLTFLLYAALGGALFFLPLYLIQVRGYAATEAGAALLPFIALMFALSRWMGGLVARTGARLPLTVGPLIAAAGFAALAVPGLSGSYWTAILPGVAVLGLGMAVTVAPLTTAVMSSVPEARSGVAAGVNNAVARTAGALAIAAFGAVVGGVFGRELQSRVDARPVPAAARQVLLDQTTKWAAAEVPALGDPELEAALRRDVDEAFLAGYRTVMGLAAVLALASAGSAAAFVRPPRSPEA